MLHWIGHVRNLDDYEILEAVLARRGILLGGEGSIMGFSLIVPEAKTEAAVRIIRSMPWIESELLSKTLPLH